MKLEPKMNKITHHTHDDCDNEESLWGWRRVCGVDQIRRVVEGLGDSPSDQELRISLVTSLLADRRDVVGTYCTYCTYVHTYIIIFIRIMYSYRSNEN